jgi:hypothetical protein
MESSQVKRAIDAARSMASALGLRAEDGVVIQNSNRLTMRLTPCDVLARVAPLTHHGGAELEIKVSQQLSDMDCPVERPEPRVEPRVYVSDGFVITFWTATRFLALPQILAPMPSTSVCLKMGLWLLSRPA